MDEDTTTVDVSAKGLLIDLAYMKENNLTEAKVLQLSNNQYSVFLKLLL